MSEERKYTCVIVMRDELVREWGRGRDGRERLTREENGERERETDNMSESGMSVRVNSSAVQYSTQERSRQ